MVIDDKAEAINALIDAVESIERELGITPSGVYSDVRVRIDILEARINNPFAPGPNVENPFFIGNDGVSISTGDGYPTENRLSGSLYLRKDGYNNEGLYITRPDGYWHLIDTDSSQYFRVILNGSQVSGGQFDLNIPTTAANLALEDGKSYDLSIRVLVNNTSGSPTCARYVFDVLAHCESGILTLDVVNATISNDNGTSWTVSLPISFSNELVVRVDSSGVDDRRAVATVEWRELSRLQ